MNEELLHAAFKLVVHAHDAVSAKKILRVQFPEADFDTLTDAYVAARDLHASAYDVADAWRDGNRTKGQSLIKLRELCPGFSDRTYQDAFAQGLFESR